MNMKDIKIDEINSKEELHSVLNLCYKILGYDEGELYSLEAWEQRWVDGKSPMLYAKKDNKIVAAVLGRAENEDSMILGFVACDANFRRQGITKSLMMEFEKKCKDMNYKYITLGSRKDIFYENCGYKVIHQINGQNIYQKML